jgi:hypothetical protein
MQLVPVAGSPDCVKLVATGHLPYSLPSVEPLCTAVHQGAKAKIFYTAYQGNISGGRRGCPSAPARTACLRHAWMAKTARHEFRSRYRQ